MQIPYILLDQHVRTAIRNSFFDQWNATSGHAHGRAERSVYRQLVKVALDLQEAGMLRLTIEVEDDR